MNARGDGKAWARLAAIDHHDGDLRLLAWRRLYGEPAGGAAAEDGDGGTELHIHGRIMTGEGLG
jgi:hypothetical protein